ncbi:unnamed protein product [Orchesella dallaii]|uniref:Protein tipE n=1 Tax=Orchesella dallaii TaxID=48710 RepID=A0ABP1RRA9_9HEXA
MPRMPGEEEARVGSSAQLATTALTTTTTTPSGSGAASSILSSSTTSTSAAPKVSLPVLALRGNPASTGTGSVPSLPTVSGGSSSTLATITTPATTIAPIVIASCPSTSVNNNTVSTINTTGATLLTNLNSSGLNTGTVDTTVFNNNANKKHQSLPTNPLGGTRAVPHLQSNSTVSGIYNNYNNKPQQHHLHHLLPQQQPALSSQLSLKPITSTTPNGHSSTPETKLDARTCNGHGGYHGGLGIEDDEIDDAGDSSKLELQLQFAGIDNETVDVDVEDEENNFEGGPMCTVVPTSNKSNGNGGVGGRTGGGADKSSHPTFPGDIPGGGVVVASSVAAAGSAAPASTTSSTLGGGGGGTGPTNSLGVGGQLVGTTAGGGGSTLGDEEEDEEEEDVEGGKTVECTEVVVPDQTFAEKCLFYTTAFFILLAVFSLFAFLFLVPFVIDPAFTTIFMEFDPEPAFCQTVSLEQKQGQSNCNWTSCREGCTREVFQCKQIKVNYRSARKSHSDDFQRGPNNNRNNHNAINHISKLGGSSSSLASSDLRRSEHYGSSFNIPLHNYNNLVSNSLIDYGGGIGAGGAIAPLNTYHTSSSTGSVGNLRDVSSSKLSKSHFKNMNNLNNIHHSSKYAVLGGSAGGGLGELTSAIVSHNSASARSSGMMNLKQSKHNRMLGQQLRSASVQQPSVTNGEEEPFWDYLGAHLFPNVKGCGYPPVVVCSDFVEKYGQEGTNFSCYYSKVDRALVVTSYDMSRVIMDLVYSMAIPIPSFIISVVYLIFAYFRIYNTESSSSTHETGGGGRAERLNSSSTTTNLQNPGSANRGGGGSSADDPDAETSISVDDKTCIIQRSTSRGLNALSDKLPNSGKGLHAQVIEMNDLNPQLRHPVDGDVFLPKRNNNCNPPPPHERNGPTNPAARNKGQVTVISHSHPYLTTPFTLSSIVHNKLFLTMAHNVN